MTDPDPQLADPTCVLVLDGAMGTELQRRGHDLGLPLWSAGPLLRSPDAITALHTEYLEAGADVLTANTFRTNPRTFRRAGLSPATAREATHRAVDCARAAITRSGRSALVAGSVAPLEDCYHPELVPSDVELDEEHGLLASWLAEAGVDVVLLETMNTLREARAATRAATRLGLIVWASFITGPAPDRLLSGESLGGAGAEVADAGASAVGVNCVRPALLLAALEQLGPALAVPLLGYANGGRIETRGGEWGVDAELEGADWAAAARAWIALGARLVGGCCGTSPRVTRSLRNAVDKLASGPYDPVLARTTKKSNDGK